MPKLDENMGLAHNAGNTDGVDCYSYLKNQQEYAT